MKNKIWIAAIAALAVIVAICGYFFCAEYQTAQEEIAEYDGIQSRYTEVTRIIQEQGAGTAPVSETGGLPVVEVDFAALREANPETVGWIAIPDTVISYPVMQATDNSKYLHTSFEGNTSKTGAIFIDKNNSTAPLDQNTVIYGHNMGKGRTDMFGTLLYYEDPAYYEQHKYIQFDTNAQQHDWWKIFAVINLDVKHGEFDYLKLSFQDQKEFMAWVNAAKSLSLYDTGVAVGGGDKVITLSTCDRRDYGKNGRQLILAVQIKK